MAFEIPNIAEALGKFDGRSPPANPLNPIFTSKGIQPFDPSTTPVNPVGGFTRLAVSNYLIQMLQGIDWREGVVMVSCSPGTPMLLTADLLAPAADDVTDGLVTVLGPGEEDAIFAVVVYRVTTGFDGTEQL